jgi:hypothetical protein
VSDGKAAKHCLSAAYWLSVLNVADMYHTKSNARSQLDDVPSQTHPKQAICRLPVLDSGDEFQVVLPPDCPIKMLDVDIESIPYDI